MTREKARALKDGDLVWMPHEHKGGWTMNVGTVFNHSLRGFNVRWEGPNGIGTFGYDDVQQLCRDGLDRSGVGAPEER
jgi:hypothetical protein